MKLYEITESMAALLALLDQAEDNTWAGFVAGNKATEPTADALQQFTEDERNAIAVEIENLEGDLGEKLEQIVTLIKSWEAEEAVLRAEARRLSFRAKARANRCEHLKEYAQQCLEAAGLSKLKLTLWTARLRTSKRVDVLDVAALPREFVRIEPQPMKSEIAAAFKAGQEVPGAVWSEHTSFSAS